MHNNCIVGRMDTDDTIVQRKKFVFNSIKSLNGCTVKCPYDIQFII